MRFQATLLGVAFFLVSLDDFPGFGIVGVNLPGLDLAVDDFDTPGSWARNLVVGLALIGCRGLTEHGNERALAQDGFDVDSVIREHFEILGPTGQQDVLADGDATITIDKAVIIGHKGTETVDIAGVDGLNKGFDGFNFLAGHGVLSDFSPLVYLIP